MQLHAVGTGVDVAAVGIAIDQTAARTEVASAVVLVKTQRRKFEQIDIVARQLVFK